jgi:GntR family transcriptional regulator
MEEELTAVLADVECSKLLQISRGAPILKIERVAYTFNNVAVEFRESWVNTQHVRYYRDQGTAY